MGVNVQKVGIQGVQKLTAYGDRYAAGSIPDDDISYDILSQTAQAVRDQYGLILGGLQPQKIIASGHSQSAQRLITYANAIQPVDQVFDGIHDPWPPQHGRQDGIRRQAAVHGGDSQRHDCAGLPAAIADGRGLAAGHLQALYPTHADYVAKYKVALDGALAKGYIRPVEHVNALKRAQAAAVPQ